MSAPRHRSVYEKGVSVEKRENIGGTPGGDRNASWSRRPPAPWHFQPHAQTVPSEVSARFRGGDGKHSLDWSFNRVRKHSATVSLALNSAANLWMPTNPYGLFELDLQPIDLLRLFLDANAQLFAIVLLNLLVLGAIRPG